MKILFVKEIEDAGSHLIDLVGDGLGETAIDSVYLQLTEDDTMSVTGTCKDSEEQVELAIVSLKDFNVANEVSSAGLYVVDAGALSSLTIDLTSGEKVIVKAVY